MNSRKRNLDKIGESSWRIKVLSSGVFLFLLLVFFRLCQIQIFQHNFYAALAQNQHELFEQIVSDRGDIYIKDDSEEGVYPVAVNMEMFLVYIAPVHIQESESGVIAEFLSEKLDVEADSISEKMKKVDDPYEIISHKISKDVASEIEKMDFEGVGIVPESVRYYPGGSLASNVIGFVGYSGDEKKGQYGIERYCNEELEGEPGTLELEKDTFGSWISFGTKTLKSAEDGEDIILTIDYTVQYLAEQKLKEAVENYEADGGNIIVMDPKTGEVLAMAEYPNYDLNKYYEVEDMGVFLNSSISDLYEPGSVQKPITMAIGIDTGKVSPSTTYFDTGLIQIDGWNIRNSDGASNGRQTMVEVLEKSLNTGTIFVQQQVGKKDFYTYLKGFGLDNKTGIELNGETAGNLSNLEVNSDINYATASFGQGISLTPLEMLTAISSFANDGKMMKPYLIDGYMGADGNIREIEPVVTREVVSSRTANLVAAMMVSVVNNGHATAARVKGYKFAGKTGTAQIPDDEGGYDSENTIHTFVGFGPMPSPKFSILVKLDSPKNGVFAANTTASVFSSMSEELVKYYHIAPTEEE